jgi:hypothetical protein
MKPGKKMLLAAAVFGIATGDIRARSFSDMTFTVDWAPGTFDINGQYMGGTELMYLTAHKGRLYAGNSYWNDEPDADPMPGCQILRKDSANGDWVVDLNMGQTYGIVKLLNSVTFTTDAQGNPLNPPVNLLVASGYHNPLTTWTRDDQTGTWTESDRIYAGSGGLPAARSAAIHVDKVTGVCHIFGGFCKDPGFVIKGVYNPAVKGKIDWEDQPEFSAYNRFMAFAEANGVLYATSGPEDRKGALYRRIDGFIPLWELVWEWTSSASSNDPTMRGLTAVVHPSIPDKQALIWERDGIIERVDPLDNHRVTTEIIVGDFLKNALGVTRAQCAIGAYNSFTPVRDPSTGETVYLAGFGVNTPDNMDSPNNGQYFVARSVDGTYEHGYVYDYRNPVPAGANLRSIRTIEVSPFARDSGRAFYFGGFDGAGGPWHNTAWIYRGTYGGAGASTRFLVKPAGIHRGLHFGTARPRKCFDIRGACVEQDGRANGIVVVTRGLLRVMVMER